jgi:hypothetical protein
MSTDQSIGMIRSSRGCQINIECREMMILFGSLLVYVGITKQHYPEAADLIAAPLLPHSTTKQHLASLLPHRP